MKRQFRAVLMLVILLASTIVIPSPVLADEEDDVAWDPISQPWAQYGRDPGHSRELPEHGDTGLMTIETPAVNWVSFDNAYGADGYGVAIADMANSITAPEGAKERCGENHLFAVMTHTGSNSERYLAIIEGDTAKVAWEVNLGDAKYIRSTPVIVDVNGDDKVEIAIAYDTDSALKVDLWSPDMTCDESGWTTSGHSNEKLWSWSDSDLRMGITSPHWITSQTNHLSVTQPLLADLSLDGSPELVLATVDTSTDEPTVISLPLGLQTPEVDWQVALDRGTHPSDPAFAALDDNSGSVVLTTVDSNSGNMWVWRIDGPTGSLDWERVSIQGTNADQDTPRLRLPGPVITQLDSDAAPEMILTLPADSNGGDEGMGAQYVGMELTSTSELWRFRAKNGYGDAEPLPVDTTGNGITDRVCWATWYAESLTDRAGSTGCHDITISPPFREWSRILQRGGGTDNDEIAVSPPISIDLDGEDEPELLVAFGKRIFAFDGNTGTSADIGTGWSAPIDVPHRTWAAPAVADMDGDGYLDILVGDTLISEAKSDVAPLADGRGIGFTPTDPDPGEMVTISGQYSNIGIVDTDTPVDAVLILDGVEIERHRTNVAESIAPSGEGGPITFSVDVEATLGVHTVELVLDVNNNLTQTRYDNDNFSTTLVVLEPYAAQIQTPADISRTLPGTTQVVDVTVISLGSRNAAWTLSYDDNLLPDGWTFNPLDVADLSLNLERDVPQVVQFEFTVPIDALGSDDAQIPLSLVLDQNENISSSTILPLEVERTRGLSLQGSTGLPMGIGYGRPGDVAHVWILVENVGNAQETTEMQWSSNTWTADTTIVDYGGNTQWSIELDPSAKEEYLIEFEIPSTRTLGETTSAVLTLCIGSGDDEICEDFTVTVFASEVSSNIPHIRTVPDTGLSWDIDANYDGTTLSWDISEAGMLKQGWNWSASGDLAINGTMLEMTGQNGQLHLDLPLDTPPMRHYFNQSEESIVDADFVISLHVLQVFRAEAEVVTPGDGTVVNVSERTKLILKLQNPGNGEDTFTLSGSSLAGNLSQAPNVTFEFQNTVRTLGPGGISMVPVWITLPEDVPARESFQLVFDWISNGDPTVGDQALITIEARPDHRWDIEITQGEWMQVSPGTLVNLTVNLTNIGNNDDLLTLTPMFNVTYSGNDTSLWESHIINSTRLNVNEQEVVNLLVSIPENTWAGTVANLTLIASSSGYNIATNSSILLEVENVAGWRFDLSNTSLEIPPEGGELEIIVEQKGNNPTAPYFNKAGQSWDVILPSDNPMINPGESSIVTINVTPPIDAVAGEVGVISIRISNGNGDGQIIEEIPVRVGSAPGIIIDSKDPWKVRPGVSSWPTTWIENTGNDVAIMDISVAGLPPGWILSGDSTVVVAPGEIIAVPLQIEPTSTWNGNNILLDIELTHPTLGTIIHQMTISESDIVLVSSPIHTGRTGEKVAITTDSLTSGVETTLVSLPDSRKNITHNTMVLHLIGIPSPIHDADCDNQFGNLDNLGKESISRVWSSCLVTSNIEHSLVANAWLLSSDGEILDSSTIRLNPNDNTTLNLSVVSWDPMPGTTSVRVLIVDSNGITLYESSSTHISRESGWNIKLASLNVDENYIDIGIDRVGYEKMEGSICQVEISLDDGSWSRTVSVDIYGSKYAPSIRLDRPSEIDDNAEVSATVSCLAPWDIDDNTEDNSMTALADKLPLVTYESSDLYWTSGIAVLLLVLAYLTGILKLKQPQKTVVKKEQPKLKVEEKPKAKQEKDAPEDDMSLEQEFDDDISEQETVQQEIEEEIVVEEEIIDIDDHTASGRLSALRKEIDTDGDGKSQTQEDMSKRLDSFFSNR